MQTKRRAFLKGSLAAGATGVAVGAGLLTPRAVMAAWPNKAYEKATTQADALKAAWGTSGAQDSGDVNLKAPDIAENGAVVPVTASTTMKADKIAILVEGNDHPLCCDYSLKNADPFLSTRIKMGKTSNVVAVVHSGGKLYQAKKEVKVTIGGCGG